jgi:thiamine-phosphate pyrophosphorylase
MEDRITRLIDANANRAREGLRVLEDVARFILDEESLTSRVKECRHRITEQVAALRRKAGDLQSARDSEGDVGRPGFAGGERDRGEVGNIVVANAHRVQEALRVLEEFSKLSNSNTASLLKDLRYSVYTLEKEMLEALSEVG